MPEVYACIDNLKKGHLKKKAKLINEIMLQFMPNVYQKRQTGKHTIYH